MLILIIALRIDIPLLLHLVVVESVVTKPVLALTSDVSKTVVLSVTSSPTDSPSLSSASPNEPSSEDIKQVHAIE